MTTHLIKIDAFTFRLIDSAQTRFLLISGFIMKDNSAYLTINSGAKINYSKYSYHPKERIIKYGFTDEVWKHLKRPNKEKTKSLMVGAEPNQLICSILVDQSSLFRTDKTTKPLNNELSLTFPAGKVFLINFSLENDVPIIACRFIDADINHLCAVQNERKRIYKQHKKPESASFTGIAQLMDDASIPWKMLCIGI